MSEHHASVRLAWRDIAISAIVLCVALVAVVSVVSTLKDADTLSVVALALAVIAFVAQIIMFIVQAAAASKQQEKAQEVYAQTMRALTLIEEKMEGTRQTVHTMSEKLLSRVLSGALPEPVAKEAMAAEMESSARHIHSIQVPPQRREDPLPTRSNENGRDLSPPYPPPAKSEENKQIIELMQKLPEGADLEAAKNALAKATVREAYYLSLLAQDELQSRRPGTRLGPGLSILPMGKELFKRGLVRQVRLPQNPNKTVFVLTEKGRNAGRIFTATEDFSSDFPQELRELHKKVADYRAELTERQNAPDLAIPVEDNL
ncbi:hypothetical protein [Micromonospora saelicesensis]|uniref:Uncharacterized protein n=1 Tax=Micromonospora saelicesensis TaxID=285676 RepID=A0A1C4UXA1_9ACTN|nr:hypothetical protein [Micromonospora saelicesensis]SCE76314.1 hypothetical protein GA0070561_1452 [Micromonospora saelicesensis]